MNQHVLFRYTPNSTRLLQSSNPDLKRNKPPKHRKQQNSEKWHLYLCLGGFPAPALLEWPSVLPGMHRGLSCLGQWQSSQPGCPTGWSWMEFQCPPDNLATAHTWQEMFAILPFVLISNNNLLSWLDICSYSGINCFLERYAKITTGFLCFCWF